MQLDDACHVRRVQQELNRTEDAALGNTTRDQQRFWHSAVNSDGLRSLADEGADPR